MRLHHLLVLPALLWIGGCQPLHETPEEDGTPAYQLVPLDSIPIEWGHLVAVTPHTSSTGVSTWYELWFSEPTSGRVTLVPVYRPELSYDPALVDVVHRVPNMPETASAQRGP